MHRPSESRKIRRVSLFQLVAATYFMVSGGPYGLEEIVRGSSYAGAILILLITPVIWSIPTALMVGELSSAIPEEGGFYIWVRRALGPFWGFQEAWLSMAASVFDMAIYPTLFVAYLTILFPSLEGGGRGLAIGVLMVAACALWNLGGSRSVGRSSLLIGAVLLSPFAVIVVLGFLNTPPALPLAHANHRSSTLVVGILVAMWNYMGWDNASTIAGEVENPRRTYPLAMGITTAAVAAVYLVSVAAAWHARIDTATFGAGGWALVGQVLGGRRLETLVVVGGCVSTFGTFNSLVMSYSRLPLALAQDKLLPRMFLRKTSSTGAPWVSILACSVAWALSLGIGFRRLVELDILLYGASLLLEFIALAVLRVKEPALPRPFKVPGGLPVAILLGVAPALLLGLSLMQGEREQFAGINVMVFALALAIGGAVYYWASMAIRSRRTA